MQEVNQTRQAHPSHTARTRSPDRYAARMDALRDLNYSMVVLRRDRAFTAAALLALALGIGATTAVFSVIYGVLLRPLPYPEPDRLVRIYEEHPGAPNLPASRRRAAPH